MRGVGSVPPHPEEDQALLKSLPHHEEDQSPPHTFRPQKETVSLPAQCEVQCHRWLGGTAHAQRRLRGEAHSHQDQSISHTPAQVWDRLGLRHEGRIQGLLFMTGR